MEENKEMDKLTKQAWDMFFTEHKVGDMTEANRAVFMQYVPKDTLKQYKEKVVQKIKDEELVVIKASEQLNEQYGEYSLNLEEVKALQDEIADIQKTVNDKKVRNDFLYIALNKVAPTLFPAKATKANVTASDAPKSERAKRSGKNAILYLLTLRDEFSGEATRNQTADKTFEKYGHGNRGDLSNNINHGNNVIRQALAEGLLVDDKANHKLVITGDISKYIPQNI